MSEQTIDVWRLANVCLKTCVEGTEAVFIAGQGGERDGRQPLRRPSHRAHAFNQVESVLVRHGQIAYQEMGCESLQGFEGRIDRGNIHDSSGGRCKDVTQ